MNHIFPVIQMKHPPTVHQLIIRMNKDWHMPRVRVVKGSQNQVQHTPQFQDHTEKMAYAASQSSQNQGSQNQVQHTPQFQNHTEKMAYAENYQPQQNGDVEGTAPARNNGLLQHTLKSDSERKAESRGIRGQGESLISQFQKLKRKKARDVEIRNRIRKLARKLPQLFHHNGH